MMGVLKLLHSNTWIKHLKCGYWGLQQSFQNDWQTLEGNLFLICNQLALHNTLEFLNARPCPLHCLYGYLKLHETHKLAEDAIQRSLDGFMVLIGYCSFLLICHHFIHPVDFRYLWELDLIKPPIWLNAIDLQKFQPLTLETIQAIKDSELVDFIIPHTGIIVFSHCLSLQEIKIFIQHNILVYFFWGKGGITQCLDPQFHIDVYWGFFMCIWCCSEALWSGEQKNLFWSITQALCKNAMRVPGIIYTEECMKLLISIDVQI